MSAKSSVLRRIAALLSTALTVMAATTFGTRADPVRYQKGDGGRGLDAFVELGVDSQVRLGLIACDIGPKSANLQLGLFPGRATKVDPEIAPLWAAEDGEIRRMQVCTAGRCRDTDWRHAESGYGDGFFAQVSLAAGPGAPLDSIRIAIPDAHGDYLWRGDLGAVLRKICR